MNPGDREMSNFADDETMDNVYDKYLRDDAAICQVEYDSELEEMDRNYPNDDSDSESDGSFHLSNGFPKKVGLLNDENNAQPIPIDLIINSEPMKVKDRIILDMTQKLKIAKNEKDEECRKAMLLTADMEKLAADNLRLARDLQVYEHECKNLNDAMAAFQSKCDQLKIDLARKDSKIELLEKCRDIRGSELQYEASLTQLQERHSMELRKMQLEINTKDNDAEIIRKKYEDRGVDLIRLEKDVEEKSNRIKELQKEVEDNVKTNRRDSKEISVQCKELEYEIQNCKMEMNEKNMEITKLTEETRKLERKCVKLSEDIWEKNIEITKLAKLTEEIDEVKNKYVTLSEKYQKEKKIASEVVGLQTELGYFKDQVKAMKQEENEQMQTKDAALVEANLSAIKITKISAENSMLRIQVEDAENKWKTLKAEHELLAKRLASLESSTAEKAKTTESRFTSPMKTNVLKHKSTQYSYVSTAHMATSPIKDRKVQTAEKSTSTPKDGGQMDRDVVIRIMHELGNLHQKEIQRVTQMERDAIEQQNERLLSSIFSQCAAKLENHKEQVVRLEMELKAAALEITKLRSKYENAKAMTLNCKTRYEAKILQCQAEYKRKKERLIEATRRLMNNKEESSRDQLVLRKLEAELDDLEEQRKRLWENRAGEFKEDMEEKKY